MPAGKPLTPFDYSKLFFLVFITPPNFAISAPMGYNYIIAADFFIGIMCTVFTSPTNFTTCFNHLCFTWHMSLPN